MSHFIRNMRGSVTSRSVFCVRALRCFSLFPISQSSVYMRTWALTRWPENTQVDLAEELPRLKVEIKLHREEQEENDEGEFADGPTILSEARRR